MPSFVDEQVDHIEKTYENRHLESPVGSQVVGRYVEGIIAEHEKEKTLQGDYGLFHWMCFAMAEFTAKSIGKCRENVGNYGE